MTNLADLGSELDVLLGSAGNLLLRRHCGGMCGLDVTGGFVILSATVKSNFWWVEIGCVRMNITPLLACQAADLTFYWRPQGTSSSHRFSPWAEHQHHTHA
jgi:hypothetical protein